MHTAFECTRKLKACVIKLVHYVPHAKHMESGPSDEMAKRSQDDDSAFKDMIGLPICHNKH